MECNGDDVGVEYNGDDVGVHDSYKINMNPTFIKKTQTKDIKRKLLGCC